MYAGCPEKGSKQGRLQYGVVAAYTHLAVQYE